MTMRYFVRSGVLAALVGAAGCSGTDPVAGAAASDVVQLAREHVATATLATLSAGPRISGQLSPAREATVRAQVGGSIVRLNVDRGQPVRGGATIAQISSRDLQDTATSASTVVKSAETALAVAQSELQRTETLVKGGALAARDLEQARNAVANAQAQLASAKSRHVSAQQLLDDTAVRAPFSGVINERPANLGDVVAPGTPIVTIIDPSSMQLEALVPSDQIASVRQGMPVKFNIRGFPNQTFTGTIQRVAPTADIVTRQVAIFVQMPNVDGKLIAGLFVEGRVETAARKGVVVPLGAVDETGPFPTVTRVSNGKAERVIVELGIRQSDKELVEVEKGISAGDVLITGSAKGVSPGTPVKVVG
jgi:RND family efflux transporter MFP subunit